MKHHHSDPSIWSPLLQLHLASEAACVEVDGQTSHSEQMFLSDEWGHGVHTYRCDFLDQGGLIWRNRVVWLFVLGLYDTAASVCAVSWSPNQCQPWRFVHSDGTCTATVRFRTGADTTRCTPVRKGTLLQSNDVVHRLH